MDDPYTGIRTVLPLLRYNCWVEFNTRDAATAVDITREKLREQIRARYPRIDPSIADRIEPWEVKFIPASWEYPDRTLVTW